MMKILALTMEADNNANSSFAEVTASIQSIIAGGLVPLSDRGFIDQYNQLGQVVRDYSEKFSFLSAVSNFAFMMLLQKLVRSPGSL